MKKLAIAIAVLLLSTLVSAQSYTTVTATLQDSSTQVWANATWTTTFQPPAGNNNTFTNQGTAITAPQSGTANGSGVFTVTLDDNNVVGPSGSKWQFTVCPNASVVACNTVAITITGATQDVSTTINAVLTVPVVNASPSVVRAYADSEVNGSYGALYTNVTTNTVKQCTVGFCTGTNWAALGGGSPGGAAGGDLAGTYPNPTVVSSNGNSLAPAAELKETTITLTSAQIKSLTVSSSGILQVLPAPGAGLMYEVDFVEWNYQFGTTPYATGAGSITTAYYDGGTGVLGSASILAGLNSSVLLNTNPVGSAFTHNSVTYNGLATGNGVLTNTVNRPIGVYLASGSSYTTGDGICKITFRYRIVAVQ